MKSFKKIFNSNNEDENNSTMEKRNLWKSPNINYQYHVSSKSDNISESHREPVFINDLKKRKEVYGICGECNKPDNSSEISTDFLNEIKSYISDDFSHVIPCFGITQDPSTKDYMIVLFYCQSGNLRNCLNKSVEYTSKIEILSNMANGLSNIHNSGKVHKDFHSGIYGVLPYMAPEILRGGQYEKSADIYSFGIIMNEYISEEIPYNDIPHDNNLAIKICEGLRPKISDDTPKLISELIVECWDAKPENRPTAKKICKKLQGWRDEAMDRTGDIYTQIKECEKIRDNKTVPENIQIHPQAIYTSRLLSFENLPEPVNSNE
ncbi:uncharacterized protein OCT59_021090 [Rhizophagus irregularis]|uniref:uncharacterized protein n=1 Tax=Rhizophagus irregularis TaxID=588596 RepID=UPI00332E1102|nr:hypothetical protein OCT59_021090 [Rhizophagus irregularis]